MPNRAFLPSLAFALALVPPPSKAAEPTLSHAAEIAGKPSLLLADAAWTWFNDERVILADQHLYLGGVSRDGRVKAYAYRVDPPSAATVQPSATELSTWTERDDHNNPAFLRFEDKLLAVYSKHHTDTVWNWRVARISPSPQSGPMPITWSE